ncbi:MAG: M20/M25/M40 family metallo-hydrolase [Flavobacteriaceae bacterium]
MIKKVSFLWLLVVVFVHGQNKLTTIETDFKRIYTEALTQGQAYPWLSHLSNQIGGRLSGSLNAERAVYWAKEVLEEEGLDSVWLEAVMVPKWVRGTFEYAHIETSPGNTIPVPICALGGSVATPAAGLQAKIVEVKTFEELKALGKSAVEGKIVFFNRPMQADLISTFESYSGCVNQRYNGAEEAASLGARGVIVRSMNLRLDDFPHTGSMSYGKLSSRDRIPAAAISTNGAELLSSMLKLNPDLEFFFKQNCSNYPDVKSYNVIGELTGSEKPEEYIVVGGHLDSWDLGDGAHDDGAGVVQSMEVLRLFKRLNIRPKNSLRVVLFMNEENGLRGGKAYAKGAKQRKEKHIFALESDAGGFTPRGFSFQSPEDKFKVIQSWEPYFKPYLIHYFEQGGSGADVRPLKTKDNVLAGLRPDSQRYFDYHHAANDTFEAVNARELALGAATMTALVYLVDQYGWD